MESAVLSAGFLDSGTPLSDLEGESCRCRHTIREHSGNKSCRGGGLGHKVMQQRCGLTRREDYLRKVPREIRDAHGPACSTSLGGLVTIMDA
jgi:hypothetical protein